MSVEHESGVRFPGPGFKGGKMEEEKSEEEQVFYCYLCGKDRKNHEVGCYEPLISSEVMTDVLYKVAEYLGIVLAKENGSDGIIAFLARRPTEQERLLEPDNDIYFAMSDGAKNASYATMRVLKHLSEMLDEGDVTLVSKEEALRCVKKIVI